MLNLLLESAVRTSLVALCTGAMLSILRVKAARVRHVVWASVVVLMLAMPIWTAWGPRAVVRVLRPASAPATSSTIVSTLAPASTPEAPIVHHPTWAWPDTLLALYSLGFFALLTRLVIGTARAQILLRRAERRDGRLSSDSCTAPITIGWLTPAVILPKRWPQWTPSQLNAVLTHESEHARRRDPLVQWLALLNRAIFWFHPLAWWLERRLSVLAEEACDAAVLARGHDPLQYSEYLLDIARMVQQTGARISVVGMAMPGTSLPRRIKRILEVGPVQQISRLRIACVAVACAMISTVFTAGAVDYRPSHAEQPVVTARPPLPIQTESLKTIEPSPSQRIKQPGALLAQAQTRATTPAPTPAASGTGLISGTVEDPSGARIPNCVITARNQTDSSVVAAVSDPAGSYQLILPPGDYSLDFASPGFAHLTIQAQIEESKPARIDAMLDLGKINEHVTVTAPKPAVQAPPTAQPASPARIRVGGMVQPMRLISKTTPIYPSDLEQQGIEGAVLIRAVISKDGEPLNPHVLNTGIDQRFVQAALDSVRQWRYQPAMLNGEPVETATTITVEFRLAK